MRWPLMLRETNAAEADGEVAWSRSPDAGIKPEAIISGNGG